MTDQNSDTVKLFLSFSEMEFAGLDVEDVEIRSFFQCNCTISEYSRRVNGVEIKRWYSDGGCRDLPVEISKTAAYGIYGKRIAKANKTLQHFKDEEAKGRRFGARSSGPKYKAQALLKYSLDGLASL